MDDEEKTIADEEFGQVGILMFAGDDFVHGEADGFKALELLNLADDCGLVNVDKRAHGEWAEEMEQAGASDEPDDERNGKNRAEDAGEQSLAPGG